MIELTIIYAGLCWAVFKWLRLVRVNTWTVLTAVIIGTLGIGFLIVMMNFHQPKTREARFMFYSTAIISEVNGRVLEVPVKARQRMKKGEVLVRLDPEPFKLKVEEAKAGLAIARRSLRFTGTELARYAKLVESHAVPVEQVDTIRDSHDEAEEQVKKLEVQLAEAAYNLEHSVITAPTDGYVAQLMVRPGFMTVPLPFAPLMVFVHEEAELLVGVFSQNVAASIKSGDEVEIAFLGRPGHVFKGKVVQAAAAIAEGQLLASGELQSASRVRPAGRVPVQIQLDEATLGTLHLPEGASGVAAVYTGKFKLTGILRRLLLRMESWRHYVVAA
jgi:multidrug resistance efflux pump